jgi:hypothetical protein
MCLPPSLRAQRSNPLPKHRERVDCFVALLLAMTIPSRYFARPHSEDPTRCNTATSAAAA